MKLKPYPAYKESGVDWMGKLPEKWKVNPLKHHFNIVGGSTPKSDQVEYWDGDITWVTPSDLSKLSSFHIKNSQRKITAAGLSSCGSNLVPTGSIILSTRAPIGSLALAEVELCTNQGCKALVPDVKANSVFYTYLLSVSSVELNARGKGTTFLELSGEELSAFKVGFPSPDEQSAIVRFLDRETSKLDTLITKQEHLIELLQEKRQTIISNAVTKGLNPIAEMKNSCVEWIGMVPRHWTVISIKWLTPVQRGASPRPIDDQRYFDDDGEFAWVRIADVSSSDGILRESTQRLSVLGSSLSVKIYPGELFISVAGTVGKPCISGIKACIHDGFVYFPSLKVPPMFLYRIFEAGDCYAGLGKLGTQLNLNTDTIGSIRIALPPLSELNAILTFIDKETTKIDTIIDKAKCSIELAKEHRDALISAAVTGKIDVREEA